MFVSWSGSVAGDLVNQLGSLPRRLASPEGSRARRLPPSTLADCGSGGLAPEPLRSGWAACLSMFLGSFSLDLCRLMRHGIQHGKDDLDCSPEVRVTPTLLLFMLGSSSFGSEVVEVVAETWRETL